MEVWTTAAPYLGVAGLIVAFIIFTRVKAGDAGSAKMVEISDLIHEGAMAFLKREYTILLVFVAVVFVALWAGVGDRTAVAFLAGAGCSIIAGFSGMKAATRANVRTAQAANQKGQGPALMMAFSGGAVMGLAVASLGLVGIERLRVDQRRLQNGQLTCQLGHRLAPRRACDGTALEEVDGQLGVVT